jgi:hypothetical protein
MDGHNVMELGGAFLQHFSVKWPTKMSVIIATLSGNFHILVALQYPNSFPLICVG